MPPGRIVGGQILWQGRDLVPLPADEMNRIRAREIAMIFQEPMTSLNPVFTVGDQIAEVIAPARGAEPQRRAGAGHRDAGAGADPEPEAPRATTIRTSSPAACASA